MIGPTHRTGAWSYAEAVVISVCAAAARYALDPLLGVIAPFGLAYVAIVLVAWRGGLGPALVASAVSWALVPALVLDAETLRSTQGVATVVGFGLTATACAVLGGSLHRALARAEATATLLQNVFEHAPAILYVKDADANVLMANRRYERIGRPCAAADARALAGDRPVTQEEQVETGDGTRTLLTTRVPLQVAGFPGRLLVGLATDITEQRRAAEEVARLQRLETVGRLVGGIAHETNNQMTIVLGFAELAAKVHGLDDRTRAEIGEIRNAAARVADLTRQLLALGRRQMLRPEVLDLDEVVDRTMSMLDRLLGPSVQLERLSRPGSKTIRADRTQLVQLLINLVINARDAMPRGGPLRIEATLAGALPERRRLRRTFTGPAVVLAVTDAGTGIAPELLDRIFEPFFTTKQPAEGTGLGLSVVEGIVEQSGGDLWVESDPGRGTTFSIALPLVSESPAREVPDTIPPAQGARRLLLVEDDAAVKATLERVLQRAGYEVVALEDGVAALSRVSSGEAWDLVVSDLEMPGLTGPELARRCETVRPELGFLFVSGHPYEGAGLTNQRGFLQKPFTPATLATAVAEALGQPPVSRAAPRTPPPSVRSR